MTNVARRPVAVVALLVAALLLGAQSCDNDWDRMEPRRSAR